MIRTCVGHLEEGMVFKDWAMSFYTSSSKDAVFYVCLIALRTNVVMWYMFFKKKGKK